MGTGTEQANLELARPESSLLSVRSLTQEYLAGNSFGRRGEVIHAVTDVSFDVAEAETVGIVGETGCGKSTLARAIMQTPPPKSGEVLLRGQDLVKMKGSALRERRSHIQMMFQDPYSSLDPRWPVERQVAEPLGIHEIGTKAERVRRAEELMALVGLDPTRMGSRRPRELSGGECQRVAMARALTLSPEVIILDEPVSSMDVSVQAQVLNLLERLRDELGLAYLFISHDLSVVRHVSDRVIVMFLGKICEVGPAVQLYESPFHPYSLELISAIPNPRVPLKTKVRSSAFGELPSPTRPPSGCRFRTRCEFAQEICAQETPPLRQIAPDRAVACHFPLGEVGSEASRTERRASALNGSAASSVAVKPSTAAFATTKEP
jgi:oligopeptide/dipeptide ABC transporter ATP-binding protein